MRERRMGKRHVLARPGWAGEKGNLFNSLLARRASLHDYRDFGHAPA